MNAPVVAPVATVAPVGPMAMAVTVPPVTVTLTGKALALLCSTVVAGTTGVGRATWPFVGVNRQL